MQPDKSPVKVSPELEAELFQLVKSFSAAREAGDRPSALRYIDRARRIAPDNPEINHLYGRLLLVDGALEPAITLFETAAKSRIDPVFEAAVIQALCLAGKIVPARERLEAALTRFSVTRDSALAEAARSLVAVLAPSFPGWVGIGPDLRLHGEVVDGRDGAQLELDNGVGASLRHLVISEAGQEYAAFDVRPRGSRVHCRWAAHVRDLPLLGSAVALPPEFGLDGRAVFSDGKISGWATLTWSPQRELDLTISGEHGFALQVSTTRDPLQFGRHLFSVDQEICAAAGNRLTIWVDLPDGRRAALPDSPLLIDPKAAPSAPTRGKKSRLGAVRPVPDGNERRSIDIVIPVYAGTEETLACIHSALATIGSDAELVVIDDASPEPELTSALDALALRGAITLLRNFKNAGFPKSANRGLKLHRDRDVVILNADTEVYGDWLARLRAAAYRDADVGTVTPLSNSGSIASYPKTEEADLGRDGAADRDRLAARVNRVMAVDIPTGVGFCLYVRRDCIAEVGYFDSATFGKGYGEENDFCLRAARAGWRHVLAADIYVRHLGSRSFGTRRAALMERNLRLLNLRYPGYDAAVAEFVALDPAHIVRRRLDEVRLIGAGRRHVLMVTLALDGGVRRAVQERAAAIRREGLSPIILKPEGEKNDRCRLMVDESGFDDLQYDLAEEASNDLAALMTLLEQLNLTHVELHHFLGLPGALIERLYGLRCPLDIRVHDYIWYCPRIDLVGGTEIYCGEPDAAGCQLCIDGHGARLKEDISVAALRERSARWLAAARAVIVPSRSVAARMQTQFPGLDLRIEPLEAPVGVAPIEQAKTGRLKIAVIGAIGDHKGFKILLALVEDAAARDLPMDFVVIGHTKDDRALMATGKVFVTGEYQEGELAALIAREKPDLALFPSVFPETWCYTLTAALSAGLPVAAFDLGAIADRLRDSSTQAMLFPLSILPAVLNDRLLRAFGVSTERRHSSALTTTGGEVTQALLPSQAVFYESTLPETVTLSRTSMAQKPNGLSATVEILPLVKGLYLFSVKSAYSHRVGDDNELVLPALQVGVGPGTPSSAIEFMYGPRTDSAWLCEPRDHIVVKVKEPSTFVLLTSICAAGMTPLELEVKRLDAPSAVRPATASPAPEPPPRFEARIPLSLTASPLPAQQPPAQPQSIRAPIPAQSPESLRLQITAHVQNRGDMVFSETQWAGLVGQRLAIESFAILPLEGVQPNMIEYKAVTATGLETPWVSGGAPCGTRGLGIPLTGFAVRAKPQAGGAAVTCEYGAALLSGATIGPARNGAPCRSGNVGDPIEGIWISISGLKEAPPEVSDANAFQPQGFVEGGESAQERPPVGPRFSIFREPVGE